MLAGVDESGRSHVPAAKSGTNRPCLPYPQEMPGRIPLTGPTCRTDILLRTSHHDAFPSGGGTAVAGYSANGILFDLWGRAGLSSSGNISF